MSPRLGTLGRYAASSNPSQTCARFCYSPTVTFKARMSYQVTDGSTATRKADSKPTPPKDPIAYEKEVYEKGLRYERPRFTFQSWKWQPLAEERMSAESKGYVSGNAGDGETAQKNAEAFRKWSIVPRRLVKTEGLPDLSVSVLGEKSPFPIAVAPVGVQKIFHPLGEVASAAAANAEGVPYVMSTASSTSIEDVAEANGDGKRWFQLYWPSNEHNDITASMLQRAKRAGFSALFVTLDTYILGWRPSDMDNGYV